MQHSRTLQSKLCSEAKRFRRKATVLPLPLRPAESGAIQFGSKAGTLQALQGQLSHARVLPLIRFTVADYNSQPESQIAQIQQAFSAAPLLIIRSSALSEDTLQTSNAGHYTSRLNVPTESTESISQAIADIINSYDNTTGTDEILVQPMLQDVASCGVAFTADLDTLAPYYIINYDETGLTDTITGGSASSGKTYIYYKHAPIPCELPSLQKLIDACREIERLFDNDCLDIEFALDNAGTVYILQVRPIVRDGKRALNTLDLAQPLDKLYRKIEKLSVPHPSLLGDRSAFGVMPDWNPAEIIGIRPKPLALSLYKELITDSIWAYQRDNYGYRNLRSNPLLVSFLGLPFIDVRVDFNSFIPKSLNDGIAEKLVNYYTTQLISQPAHHDKIEFEIVHSCYYLNLPEKLTNLESAGFNRNEIKRIEYALLNLTNSIISPKTGLYQQDLAKVDMLQTRYEKVMASDMAVVDKIYWLIEDCKRYGTLPFAGIARAAFIAIQFLQSFVDIGILSEADYHSFLNSLNTVSRQINTDIARVRHGDLPQTEFCLQYGHLRPGTYDILSTRYDQNFKLYFDLEGIDPDADGSTSETFVLSEQQMQAIGNALIENGIQVTASELIQFIREAIEGREYAKFVFTRSLSQVLEQVALLGQRVDLAREQMAFLNIQTIIKLYAEIVHCDVHDLFSQEIERNKTAYDYTTALRLPNLILKPDDVYGFFIEPETPNFITLNQVEASVSLESNAMQLENELAGKIVFISSADPGYDFLFSKGIAGLVTQYGGANSHMAIRCAELGIPAVIGAGEKLFGQWSKARTLQLNCNARQVRVLS